MKPAREIKDGAGDLVFRRWVLLRTPWFSIFLHGMYGAGGDRDQHCHDHPWNFWSLILWGGYFEVIHNTVRHHYGVRGVGSLQYMPGRGHYHRVLELNRSRSYSLVFASRKTQPWGYWTQDGWIPAPEYQLAQAAGQLPCHGPRMSESRRDLNRFINHCCGRGRARWARKNKP